METAPAERSAPVRDLSATPATIAIVVSYNSALHLASCLSSLEAQQGVAVDIHVVDNASHDGSADLVRREFPRAHLIESPTNLGFARANNQILTTQPADFYALVNPDTILGPGAVVACIDTLRSRPSAGVAATRLVFPDGMPQPSCYEFLGLGNLLGETLGVHRLLPGPRAPSGLQMPWFQHDRMAEVDWIAGAFLVVRGEVIRTVGGFDEEFFMYGEEMDWCRRIRNAGWSIVFLPEPAAVHIGGVSSKPIAGSMFVENLKGRIRFLRKHRGVLVAAVARGLIAVSVLMRFLWREGQALGAALTGRVPKESLRLTRTMFRAAMRWVLRGLPA